MITVFRRNGQASLRRRYTHSRKPNVIVNWHWR